MRGLTRFLSGMLTVSFVLLAVAAAGTAWFSHAVNAPGPLKARSNVKIPSGDSSRMIAERLESQGIISGQSVFLAQVMAQGAMERLTGKLGRTLKAGEYELQAGVSIRDVIEKLTEGRSLLYSVTLPEGLTSREIVRRLLNDQSLSGAVAQVPAEGSLMPETLRVPSNTARDQVLVMLAKEQERYVDEQWASRAADLPLRTREEALVLASIVEKESGPKDDPARIAGVFINRLRRGMRLQSDPTILYGKQGPDVKWGATIFRSDIARKTAYNTYQIDGLPPTPICNPGRKAIAAVLQPAVTGDLYFVANGQGGHVFSTTLQDHERAVKDWRKIERDIRADETAQVGVAPTLINTKPGAISATALSVADRSLQSPGVGSGAVPLPAKRPSRGKR